MHRSPSPRPRTSGSRSWFPPARHLGLWLGLLLAGPLLACLPLNIRSATNGANESNEKDAGVVVDAAFWDAAEETGDADAGERFPHSDAGTPQTPDGGATAGGTDAGVSSLMDGGAGTAIADDGGAATTITDAGALCSDETCDLACSQGFEEDSNGCPLCVCVAESDLQDGGACPPVLCDLYCETGFRQDENGCDVCDCRVDPCEGTECPDNTHCEIRPPDSNRPAVAVCVEDENPVCDLTCGEGEHCELQQVVCIQAPCPPLDVCVIEDERDGPLPVDCRELVCPPGTQCGPTPTGALACVPRLGCESILCRDNMICRLTLADDGSGEIPVCVVDPNATCDLTCEIGNRCEIVETQCDGEICPPVDRCIPDRPELSCANVDCLENHVCEMQQNEGGNVIPVCVPQDSPCDVVDCDEGWRCEEVVVDGQGMGRCVHIPPPRPCDLLCPPEQVCQLRQALCPDADAECPLVPECVPQLALSPMPGSCETIRCAAGHRCVAGPLRAGLPTSYCVSIYADYCASDGDCDGVRCPADTLCLAPPSTTPNQPAPELCYGLCLGETRFCERAEDCGPHMACDLEACVPSSCIDDVCTSDCRSVCVQKDQVDCAMPRYDCVAQPEE